MTHHCISVHVSCSAACLYVIYDSLRLTDCNQSASEHNSESLQQDCRDEEEGGEMSSKEEDRHNVMDFPAREVAEQLTRLDAVGFII